MGNGLLRFYNLNKHGEYEFFHGRSPILGITAPFSSSAPTLVAPICPYEVVDLSGISSFPCEVVDLSRSTSEVVCLPFRARYDVPCFD